MQLYDSVGPNPQVVRFFLAEKGVELSVQRVDVAAAENRAAEHLLRNPLGQTPVLRLEDGSCLTEVLAICEYLEERFPQPPLIGETAEQRAECRMWTRRIDLNICEPLINGFRFAEALPVFSARVITLPEAADGLKRIARHWLAWLDEQMEGKSYICGERFTLADIHLFAFLRFGNLQKQPLDPDHQNLQRWIARVSERPASAA